MAWEKGLYCDGALVANNPTAIALQEARLLYPGVPIEMVLSIGTGYFDEANTVQSMGWDLLVNHLVATTTDTEKVDNLLKEFMQPNTYFRLNPYLRDNYPIDEKNKTILLDLKRLAKKYIEEQETGPNAKSTEYLIKLLKGEKLPNNAKSTEFR